MSEKLLTAALDKALSRITDETGLVGGVVNVIKNGKIAYTYEYGYADRENKLPMIQDTLFDVASTSKAWTVMLAAQNGRHIIHKGVFSFFHEKASKRRKS